MDKLPPERRDVARRMGLFFAMFMRIGLLVALSWLAGLTAPLFAVFGHEISGRDLILIGGGLFLLWKSTMEIHQSMEGEEGHASSKVKATFTAVILQIIVIDIVFSLDSIITAVGMVRELAVMVAAVVVSVALMMVFAGSHRPLRLFASDDQDARAVVPLRHRRRADRRRLRQDVPKGYIYFAMAFSVGVEMLNLRMRRKTRSPVHLRQPYVDDRDDSRS